jgi:hypothetical protein
VLQTALCDSRFGIAHLRHERVEERSKTDLTVQDIDSSQHTTTTKFNPRVMTVDQ